jgi:hypothetical protein
VNGTSTFTTRFSQDFSGVDTPFPKGLRSTTHYALCSKEWLRDPEELSRALGLSEEKLRRMSGESWCDIFSIV